MSVAKFSDKDQRVIDEADAFDTGTHRPLFGVEYRAGCRKYAAQCSGCDYWTGNVTKPRAARMIINHCKSMAANVARQEGASS